MAGPVVSIPLKEPLSQTQLREIDVWLGSVASVQEGKVGDWDFWIRETEPLGFHSEAYEALPFILTFQPTERPEDYNGPDGNPIAEFIQEHEDERNQWLSHLGYYPKVDLIIGAMVSRPPLVVDRILGHLALEMASRFGGWVDVDDLVWPPAHHWSYRPDLPLPLREYEKDPLPGRILTFFRTKNQVREPYFQILDIEAFGAWLRHPLFFLIK